MRKLRAARTDFRKQAAARSDAMLGHQRRPEPPKGPAGRRGPGGRIAPACRVLGLSGSIRNRRGKHAERRCPMFFFFELVCLLSQLVTLGCGRLRGAPWSCGAHRPAARFRSRSHPGEVRLWQQKCPRISHPASWSTAAVSRPRSGVSRPRYSPVSPAGRIPRRGSVKDLGWWMCSGRRRGRPRAVWTLQAAVIRGQSPGGMKHCLHLRGVRWPGGTH